jgi:uncharacterized protein
MAGFLYRSGDGIAVGELYIVRGHVDFSTGNIHYPGSVVVRQDVKSGFEIKAGRDIFIAGNIESAQVVSKEGSVHVDGGIYGKGNAAVVAAKDIEAGAVQEAEITAEGSVRIARSATNAEITAAGSIECNTCVGGRLKSHDSLTVGVAGSDSISVRTVLELCDRETERATKKKEQLEGLLQTLNNAILTQEADLKRMNKLLTDIGAGKAGPELIVRIKATLAAYAANQKKREFLQRQLEKVVLPADRTSGFSGKIRITGTSYPGTDIVILGHNRHIIEPFSDKTLVLDNDEIKMA